ncbi:DNA-deoxyinosine glycosylase [Nitratiruptor tergarcus]|uniref:G/U mismatch-specific uracil-DNA glycosylase n=1 Tax=Nitratiruptor tergarcus DSM 16512 TaxID=1069081 RepID=A0A1W1WTP6_9BACT|nr:DNA-deoxyinosine glycosylase [Nitratiruptor tergarcus]SMC09420.1 G/U mismatch-specific uracil-DNA glycosylase [Nitratiruptor tergarcus DSM 16512]
MLQHPFEPIIDKNSKVLILGSFPSIKSFENSFYYGHPQNQFWKILATLFDEKTPQTIEEKISFLKKHHIALWDMVRSCKRENSLDTSLKDIEVNDIEKLLHQYPNIKAIFFTGKKAQKLFSKYFSHLSIPTFYLPSPSPAYRKMILQQKVQAWSILKDFLR